MFKGSFSMFLHVEVFQNSFWRPWRLLGLLGGHFVASSSWLVWGELFHRFGMCPNQEDFLEEFVLQSAPKLVLVALAPFGSPWGDLFVASWSSKFEFSPWIL